MGTTKSCIAIRGAKYSLELIKWSKKWVMIAGMRFVEKSKKPAMYIGIFVILY